MATTPKPVRKRGLAAALEQLAVEWEDLSKWEPMESNPDYWGYIFAQALRATVAAHS